MRYLSGLVKKYLLSCLQDMPGIRFFPGGFKCPYCHIPISNKDIYNAHVKQHEDNLTNRTD